jgi:hypothetical protein
MEVVHALARIISTNIEVVAFVAALLWLSALQSTKNHTISEHVKTVRPTFEILLQSPLECNPELGQVRIGTIQAYAHTK